MNFNPKISIIIPVYNGENFLADAINSAINQSYNNKEIIVVNDGSTDNTEKIAKSFGNKIRYFKKTNGGVSTALNLGISKMKGSYFAWLSHDDLYEIDKLSENIKFINAKKKFEDIIISDFKLIDIDGRIIRKQKFNSKEIRSFPVFSVIKTYINGITVLIPKKVFDKVGLFDEKLRYTQDYDMWWRAQRAGINFVHQNKILTATRIHEEQDTIKQNIDVKKDGNTFWINVFKNIKDDEKEFLSGTKLSFYREIKMVFENSPYDEVNKYIDSKIAESLEKSQYLIDKNKFLRMFWLIFRDLRYKGIRSAVGGIYRKEYWRKR